MIMSVGNSKKYQDLVDDKQKDKVLGMIKSSEPLHYNHMITNMQLMNDIGNSDALLYGTKDFANIFYTNMRTFLNSPTMSMLKIDKDVLNTLLDTDNQHFYRPLMSSFLFLNIDLEFNQRLVKGICLIDDGDIGKKQLSAMLVYFDLTDMTENHIVFKIGNNDDDIEFNKKELSFVNKLRNIVCNIVDLIGDDTLVNIVTVERDEKRNQKRLSKGKIAIPKKIVIKPKTEFKLYVEKYNKQREDFQYSHRFPVRGHWRHYRSERYSIEKQGTSKWIKPFFKGEGILIKKEYEVKKE